MDLEWQQLKHWPRKLLPTFGLHNDHPFAKMNLKLQSMEPYWMEFLVKQLWYRNQECGGMIQAST